MNEPARVVNRFLDAVGARDLDAVIECFSPHASWANVPHPPAVGHEAIRHMLATILGASSSVRWDIVTECYDERRGWVERVDRFVIDGVEYAVRCNGVFEVDVAAGRIVEVRDYVDLGEWRSRLAAASL